MQNRYAGDIGDFSKLGILRALHASGLTIGVNWYLVPDETHNGDGRHVGYLEKESFRSCDELLWLSLKRIVASGQRNVPSLELPGILPAKYYSEILDFSGKTKPERTMFRQSWHDRALCCLSGVDVVCADPDNGLIVPSAAGSVRENKYILPCEILDYYRQGSSVIYYQHKGRRPDTFYIEQHRSLLSAPGFFGSTGIAMKFITTSQRYYFFVLQPDHAAVVADALKQMLSTDWGKHFKLINPI